MTKLHSWEMEVCFFCPIIICVLHQISGDNISLINYNPILQKMSSGVLESGKHSDLLEMKGLLLCIAFVSRGTLCEEYTHSLSGHFFLYLPGHYYKLWCMQGSEEELEQLKTS